jgi:hypothetical protein
MAEPKPQQTSPKPEPAKPAPVIIPNVPKPERALEQKSADNPGKKK